jgi:NAD(P)-dependent dehydrogenase (short-subunit alcohol dehydrogenase family)
MKRLENKVAIVTGAGSIGPGWGNGKAAAVLYAREGAQVFAVDVNLAAAEETRRLIQAEGGQCVAYAANVAVADDVRGLVETCVQTYGRVDVLHNNVGIVATGGPVELSEADWDRSMAVNAKSVFLLCKHVLPIMEQQGANASGIRGTIVNIGTVGGVRWVGVPYIAYSASKAAVIQMTQSVALQYARKGIRCNCVIPGFIDTPLVKQSLAATYASSDEMDKVTAARNKLCPMGHQGDAWDVAHAALFLASDEAKYITGTNIFVDGGLSATTVTFE